ncbi:MAG: tetratricopeptide repeat protein, partial [Nitrospinaceae bacterium]
GAESSLLVIATVNLLTAPLLYRSGSYATPGLRRGVTTLMMAGVLGINLAVPKDLLTGFFMRDSAGKRDRDKLLHFSEGLTDTVAVFKDDYGPLDPEAKRLITNGISMSAANTIATRYMKLFAHVPILLSGHPAEVLVICFGTGQTTGAAGIHPRVRHVDSLELSRSVIEAAPAFRRENHDVLNNPKVNIILQDGRNHLLTTPKRYDIITGEPPPPRTAFTVNLYTRDFYEQARARLNPGGLMVQWIPLHSQSAREVDMNLATFLSVFPHTVAWLAVANEIMLVGSDRPIKFDVEKIRRRMAQPPVRQALADIYIDSVHALLANIWFLEPELRALSANRPLITDNRPRIEFYLNQGPIIGAAGLERLVFNRTPAERILARLQNMTSLDAARFSRYYHAMDLYQRGVMYSNRGLLLEAVKFQNGGDLPRYHLQAGRDQIRRLMVALRDNRNDLEAMVNLGHAWYQIGEYSKSAAMLKRALRRDPGNSLANLYLGYDYLELGEYDRAKRILEASVQRDPRQLRPVMQQIAFIQLLKQLQSKPDDPGLLIAAAQFYNMREDYRKALRRSLKVLESDQLNEKALQSALFSYRGLGEPKEVLALGARYKMVKPDDLTFQYLMAEMFSLTLQCAKAIPYLEAILRKDDTYRNAAGMLKNCRAETRRGGPAA